MQREDLVFAGYCDWSGLVRGKAFPVADTEARLAKGMGLTHSNIMMSCFGPIYTTPFGTVGDLIIWPDPHAHVAVPFDDGTAERFYLGDVQNTDGTPWECCPRDFLKRAIAALAGHGLSLRASFEQELVYTGVEDRPGSSYALDAYRRQGGFGEALIAALNAAGRTPDSFLPEYGSRQFEVTIVHEPALMAADGAVVLRELARGVAWRLGHRAILAPMIEPGGIGSGTHIHMSLWEGSKPMTHDPARPYGVSARAEPFFAGILAHIAAISAFSAAAVASYFRLTPNRWAPVRADLGVQDRGSALRVAPIFATAETSPAEQFNVEFRVADACCCPYLALGALIQAGVDGLKRGLSLSAPGAAAPLLPRSLPEALAALASDEAAKGWWSETAMSAYLAFKKAEIAALEGLDDAEICARYAAVY
ncbi:MAG TPA: glutamine synthetase family protein [Acetobacteraceae bacterium]|nr:glutamine synthetase family protein [Acetobacteraceae bacterium]